MGPFSGIHPASLGVSMSFYWSGQHQEVERPPKVPVLERDRAGFTFISSLANCSCPMVVPIPPLSVLI